MACADTGDNLGFIAAALSAMTDKHIVSKSEYLILQQQARSGIYTGYIFKGAVNVPQTIKQTYADTYQFVTQIQPTVFQRASKVVKCAIEGVGAATGLSALAGVSEGVALEDAIEMNEMCHTYEEISIPTTVIEDRMPLINNECKYSFHHVMGSV